MSNINDKNDDSLNTDFLLHEKEYKLLQFSLVIAGLAIIVALIIPVIVNKNSHLIAYNNDPGIDYTATGSIKKTKRYHIRKSIIDF